MSQSPLNNTPLKANYATVSIRLRDWRAGEFLVEVVDSPVGRMRTPDRVRFLPQIRPFLAKLRDSRGEGELDVPELVEMGELLGDMLLPPTVRRILQKSLVLVQRQDFADSFLRLQLEIDDPLLGSLPWEFVYMWEYGHMKASHSKVREQARSASAAVDESLRTARSSDDSEAVAEAKAERARIEQDLLFHGFLARDSRISIVRHESFVTDPNSLPAPLSEPIMTVMVATANPTDFGSMDTSLELRSVVEGLCKEDQNVFALEVGEEPLKLEDGSKVGEMHLTKEKLEELCSTKNFHVFHFAGHGGFLPEAIVSEDGHARLQFMEDAGEAEEGTEQTRNGPFDVRNGPFDVRNGPFDVRNGPFDVRNGPFDVRNGPFDVRNGPFDVRNGPFDVRNGPFDVRNGPFDVRNGPFDVRGMGGGGAGGDELRGALILERSPGGRRKKPPTRADIALLKEMRNYYKAVANTVVGGNKAAGPAEAPSTPPATAASATPSQTQASEPEPVATAFTVPGLEPDSGLRGLAVAPPVPQGPAGGAVASQPAAGSDTERPHQVMWSDDFARLLRKANVKIVFLNACDSGKRSSDSFDWSGITPALLKAGIPIVIGMQYPIADSTAITFAKYFYQALGAGKSIDEAVALGRRMLMKGEVGKHLQDWGIPVLYARTESGDLFPELTATTDLPASRGGGTFAPGGYGNHKDSLASDFDKELYSDFIGFND